MARRYARTGTMIVLRAFSPLIAGLLFLLPAAAVKAQVAPDRNATATANIRWPAQVRKLQDLNFGYLAVTSAGTAVIDPNTDVLTTTGGVTRLGGLAYSALFRGVSPRKGVVIVRIPKQPTTVTRVGGTETMRIDNWTVSGNNGKRTVAEQQPFDFSVGGTLHVNANQAEGTYQGTFNVDIQYP